MSIINQLLSKLSLSTLLALFAGLFSYRASSNKHERIKAEETANESIEVLQDVAEAQQINEDVHDLSDDAVDSELHDNDWYRD